MKLVYRVHALQRMALRKVSHSDVETVLQRGSVIENYPAARPFPSRLVLDRVGGRPLHVVAADDVKGQTTYVISVYEPELSRWEPDFKTRRKKP